MGTVMKKTERKPSNLVMLRKNFETESIEKPDNLKQKSNIAKQILLFETQADRGQCALGEVSDKGGQSKKVGRKQSGSSAPPNSRGKNKKGQNETENNDIRRFLKKPTQEKVEILRPFLPLKKGNLSSNCENSRMCFPATKRGHENKDPI